MPQMKPINWINLFVMLNMIILIMNINNYFIKNNNNNIKMNNVKNTYMNNNWMW